jgi:hypothetical protein
MAYQLTHLPDEASYRQLYLQTYCDPTNPVVTFDGIEVRFFPDRFDHAFFESVNRQLADKAQFSRIRAERILWIRDTLQDPTADLRVGWDKKYKTYDKSFRVAVVKYNYVVIIWVKNKIYAKFITAYEADNSIGKILGSPTWPRI